MSYGKRDEDEGVLDPRLEALAAPAGEAKGADFVEIVLRRLTERGENHARYRLEGEIDHGGQGVILRVWDEDLQRPLAMKTMLGPVPRTDEESPTESRALARFLEEAQVTGQLDHPGVVPVHELGLDEEGRVYFTMKLLRGENLRAVFEKVASGREGWTEARALGVLLKVCEAMAYAHAKGVIHRDLKPSNVMVGRYGEVYVMDWGLARVQGKEDRRDLRISDQPAVSQVITDRARLASENADSPLVTMDGHIVGTPTYMAPEQALGEVSEIGPHSDVYALGAMLYHLLAGHAPYVKPGMKLNNYAVLYRAQEGPPEPLHERAPRAPAELVAICEKAMARDWRQRYPDVGALAEDLRAYLEHRVVKAYRVGAWIELGKWIRRNRALAMASAAAVVALVAGLGVSSSLYVRAAESSALAQRNAERADREAAAAKETTAEVLQLSALQELDDLVDEADELWPALPASVPRYEGWLERAQALQSRLPHFAERLAELRAGALAAASNAASAALDASALATAETATPGWIFASPQDRWRCDQLDKLVRRLEEFSNPETGLFSNGIAPGSGWGVRRRLEFARQLERDLAPGSEPRALWQEALDSIGNPEECPAYAGLHLVPQTGLVPIGVDLQSGLWEFAHLQSGKPAERDWGGDLVLKADTGLVFVLIPGGTFWMGAQNIDPAGRNYDPAAVLRESPVHEVHVAAFFISKFEMTQGQWQAATGKNPSEFDPSSDPPGVTLLNPVENVEWLEFRRVLEQLGLDFPTEEQWEYATRAGTSTPWWTGAEPASLKGGANLSDASWKRYYGPVGLVEDGLDDGFVHHAPVGRFRANAFGLHDVIGNLWEFCADRLGLYTTPAQDGPVVVRGGSFCETSRSTRSAYRGGAKPDERGEGYGLRPVRRLEE